MKTSFIIQTIGALALGFMLILYSTVSAENIDPFNDGSQYAYGENVGWLNAEPGGDGGYGVEVSDIDLTGYIWAENVGWISLSCQNTSSCANVDYGVTSNGLGILSGYAWAENVGWIRFKGADYGVVAPVTQYQVYLPLVLRNLP